MNSELQQIQSTLKKMLKASSIQYEDVAKSLGVSNATVKRILNAHDMSLTRLSEIAGILGLSIFEIIEQAKGHNNKRYKFSLEQELYLSKDFIHFQVFRYVLLKKSKEKIKSTLDLTDKKLFEILLNLEKIGLIENHPNERIKLLANFPFQWNDNGPLERAYTQKIISRIQEVITISGINKMPNSTQTKVKEILLLEKELKSMQDEMQDLIHKYEVISKLRLKNNPEAKIVSIASIIGNFSWWEQS